MLYFICQRVEALTSTDSNFWLFKNQITVLKRKAKHNQALTKHHFLKLQPLPWVGAEASPGIKQHQPSTWPVICRATRALHNHIWLIWMKTERFSVCSQIQLAAKPFQQSPALKGASQLFHKPQVNSSPKRPLKWISAC